MQTGAPRLDRGLFTGRLDAGFNLMPRLLDDFLDTRGVNPAVQYELRQRDPRCLSPHRIEGRERHRIRSVIDDEVHAGCGLQRPDVSSLATNDAALHVVAGNGHD
jgi:hypothetical protein